MKKVCPKCGWDFFLEEHQYCMNCGTKLVEVEEEKCKCGETIGKSFKFCPRCGLPREEAVKPSLPDLDKKVTLPALQKEFQQLKDDFLVHGCSPDHGAKK